MTKPTLEVVHQSPGRLRLRAARGASLEDDALRHIVASVSELAVVREVRASARTGSLLLLFEGEAEALLSQLRALESLELTDHPRPDAPMLRLRETLLAADQQLAERTHGRVTFGTITFAVTTLAGLWQTGKGRLLPAGLTLLEYALHAAHREAEREQREVQKASLKRS
jgi:hypothetical protein